MQWTQVFSGDHSPEKAARECANHLLEKHNERPGLLLVFSLGHSLYSQYSILNYLRNEFSEAKMAGCTGSGLFYNREMISNRPGLLIVGIGTMQEHFEVDHIVQEQMPGLDGSPVPWRRMMGKKEHKGAFWIFSLSRTFDTERLLAGLDYAYPDSACLGGVSGVNNGFGQNCIYFNGNIKYAGSICISLPSSYRHENQIFAGYRIMGPAGTITSASQHVIHEIEGFPALDFACEAFRTFSQENKFRDDYSILAGLPLPETHSFKEEENYLIRSILELNTASGSIRLAVPVHTGQSIRFMLRDPEIINNHLPKPAIPQTDPHRQLGTFVMQSLGCVPSNGKSSFRKLVRKNSGPLCGIVGWGEIVKVDGCSRIHEFTSSVTRLTLD